MPWSRSRSRGRLGVFAVRQREPEVHRRVLAGSPPADALERRQQDVALAPVDVSRTLDVAPRRSRRRSRHAGRTPVEPCRPSDGTSATRRPPTRCRRRSRPVAGHRRALAERVEDDGVRPVGELERRGAAARRTRARCTPRPSRRGSRDAPRGRPAPHRTSVGARRPWDCWVVDPDERRAVEHLRRRAAVRSGRKPFSSSSGRRTTFAPATRRRARTRGTRGRGRAPCPCRARTSAKTCAKLKIASFDPSVGVSSRSGSSSTPNPRTIQPAIAARSSGRPSAFG